MIEGKVTNVLNDREIVINRGTEHGVKVDMVFEVLGQSQEVIDPETSVTLGTIEPSRIRVRVFETHGEYAVARSFETYIEDYLQPFPFRTLFGTHRTVTKVKTFLPPKSSEGYTAFSEYSAYVEVGDKVRQAISE